MMAFLIQSHGQIRARLRASLGQYIVRGVLKGCSLDQNVTPYGKQKNTHAIIISLQYIDDIQRSFEHCLWAEVGGRREACPVVVIVLLFGV